ncbi:hypothetical protein FRC02_010167 [Tulasnella sp. 418]|nr:hypothetical protein FRC02_010167 [Tulasnella sp. 418]
MVKCPVLLVHSTDDMTIPSSHSSDLFERLMDPYLPPLPYQDQEGFSPLKMTPKQLEEIRIAVERRSQKYKDLTRSYEISGGDIPFGTIREFDRKEGYGKVLWLEAHVGGHTNIVRYEGTIDLVGKIAGIRR